MKLTVRQICVLFLAIVPISKFLILPATLANIVGRDAWFCVLMVVSVDFLLLLTLLFVSDKFDGSSFFDVLEHNFNRTVARCIYFLYALYFMCKAYIPILEQKSYVEITLYETTPTITTFLPFFLVCFFLCYKGIKILARTSEIMMWPSIISLLIVIGLSFSETRLKHLLPILKTPISTLAKGSYVSVAWYSDALYLLFFLGFFKREKHFKRKIIISFVIAVVFVMVFYIVFYGVYGPISEKILFSVAKLSKFNVVVSSTGRFDYLAVLMLLAAGVVSLSLPLTVATECLMVVFSFKKQNIAALIVNCIIITVAVIFNLSFQTAISFIFTYITPFFIVMAYVIPAIVPFLRPLPQKNLLNGEKNSNCANGGVL